VISPASGAKAPAFSIVIHEKGGTERREVFDTTEVSVGRVQGNHIVLPKGNVSKRHARLLYRDGRFIVTDLNSTNGTYDTVTFAPLKNKESHTNWYSKP